MRRLSGLIAVPLLAMGAGTPLAAGEGSGTNNADLFNPSATPSSVMPREAMDPYFNVDWSLAIRGAYSIDSGGSEGAVLVIPQFTLTHQGGRVSSSVTGSGEVSVNDQGESRISALRLSADGSYAFDAAMAATGSVDVSLSQADPDDPSLPTNTMTAPVVISGDAEGSVVRRLGRLEASLRGSLGRSFNGETVLDDMSTIDNTPLNDWRAGAGSRLGFALTPVLTPYLDGSAQWQRYDAPDPTLLVYLDAVTTAGKVGVSYSPNSRLSADAAIGLAWRDYVDASLTDTGALTADGSVTLKPDETLTLTASLTTGLAPSATVPSDTTASYDAGAGVAYVVNPWVTLRGSVGYGLDRILGTGDQAQNASLGAGFDYRLNAHTALTGDYAFTRTDNPPAPVADEHSVALGVTFSR
ncbi:MAG: outer membrane beta-barrel protein [Devosia sp.]